MRVPLHLSSMRWLPIFMLVVSAGCARIDRVETRQYKYFGDLAPGILAYAHEDAAPLIEAEQRIARALPRDYPGMEDEIIALIREPGTLGARQFLLLQLKVVGSARAVPYLEHLLADPLLSAEARSALEANPNRQAGRALLRALDELNGPPLLGAIGSAGNRRDPRAVHPLRQLAGNRDPEFAQAALHALGNIGDRRALIFLATTRVPAELEPARLDALLRAAWGQESRGGVLRARRIYFQLFDPGYPTPVRIAALRGIARTEHLRALPLLAQTLHRAEPPLAGAAAEIMQGMPGPEVTFTLIESLDSPSTPTQFLALKALATRGDPSASSPAVMLIQSSDESIRMAAIETAGALRDANAAPALIGKLLPNSGEARLAQRALTVLDDPRTDGMLIDALSTSNTMLQRRLVEILEGRGAVTAVDALVGLLDSRDAGVRRGAWQALGSLASPSITYILTQRMLATDEAARPTAERAIGSMIDRGVHLHKDSGPLDRLKTIYAGGTVAEKVSLLRVLGPLRYGFSHRLLRKELKSPHRELREEAVRQIADWDNDYAAEDMLWLAKTAETEELRRLSLTSYLRLTNNNYTLRPPDKNAAMLDAAAPLVKDRDMKRMLLSGYQRLLAEDGIERATPFLDDKEVADEAAAAVIALAKTYGANEKSAARAALERAAAKADDEDVKKRARDAIKNLNEPKKENGDENAQ